MVMELVYGEETGLLRRCFFEVQNEVGPGRQEQAYQRGCELWLAGNGIPFEPKKPHHLLLHDQIALTLCPDSRRNGLFPG